MIYVTTGTYRFPFSRLLLTLNTAINAGELADEVYAQYGSFRPEFKLDGFTVKKPLFAYEEHIELIRHADLVVAHAGEDIVLLSLMLGKVPIVMPRQKTHGEHIDNHQVEFAAKMADLHKVIPVYEAHDLINTIHEYDRHLSHAQENAHHPTVEPYKPSLKEELNMILRDALRLPDSLNENWEMV